MKKIMAICMIFFMLISVGCSKNDEIVRKMRSNETKEMLNEKLKGTETIVEVEDNGFNDIINAMENGIVDYDNLYKQVNEFVNLAENNKPINIVKATALEEEIQNSKNKIPNSGSKILTYNKNFEKYWWSLIDSYSSLKAVMHNINALTTNGTVEMAKSVLEESKEEFDVISSSRGNLKEKIINE